LAGLAGCNLGKIENSIADINVDLGYSDRFVATLGGLVGQSLSGELSTNIAKVKVDLVDNYFNINNSSALSGQLYETILNVPSNFLKSYQRVINGWTTYKKKNVHQIGGLIGETTCHDIIQYNSAFLTIIDTKDLVSDLNISAYNLMESEQTLLCGYGSLAGFAKIEMNTWDYKDIVLSADNDTPGDDEVRITRNLDHNYSNNYLEMSASSAITNVYNLNNISAANPLGIIGETYIDYRIMPWVFSIDYNYRYIPDAIHVMSGSIYGPFTNDTTAPFNVGPGTELPISYTFSSRNEHGSMVSINTSEIISFYNNNLSTILFSSANKFTYNGINNNVYASVLRNLDLFTNKSEDVENLDNYSIMKNISAYQLYSDTGLISDESDTNIFNGKYKYLECNTISATNSEIVRKSLSLNFTPFKDLYYSVNEENVYLYSISNLESKKLDYKYNDFCIELSDSSIQWGKTKTQIESLIDDSTYSASGIVISETGFAGILVSDGILSSDNLIAYIDFGMDKPVIHDALVYNFEDKKFIEIGLNE